MKTAHDLNRSGTGTGTVDRGKWIAGLALLCIGAFANYFPPPPVELVPLSPNATLLERLFPTMPTWWILGRLLATLGGLMLVAMALPSTTRAPTPHRSDATQALSIDLGSKLWIATALASGLVIASFFAHQFSRPMTLLFLMAAAIPTALAWSDREQSVENRRLRRLLAPGLLLILVVWLAGFVPQAWRSPWIGTIIDTLGPYRNVVETIQEQFSILTYHIRPGVTGLHLLPHGGGWYDFVGMEPSFQNFQVLQIFWMAVAACITAMLVARVVSPQAAPVGAAVILFAPYGMLQLTIIAALFTGPLYVSSLLLAAEVVHRRRSVFAMVAMGPLAALTGSHPSFTLIAAATLGFAIVSAFRHPRLPLPAIAAALLTVLALAIPTASELLRDPKTIQFYSEGTRAWASIQAMLFGQIDPLRIVGHIEMADVPAYDAVIGTLLAPVATPRTGLRLQGDALFEPITIVLMMVGVATCLRYRNRLQCAVIFLALLALIPGFASSYDRASFLRVSATPAAVALLATFGFDALRKTIGHSLSATLGVACALAIATSGIYVSRAVTPNLIPQSAVSLMAEATHAQDPDPGTVLLAWGSDLQGAAYFSQLLPRSALAVKPYKDKSTLGELGTAVDSPLFFSPGFEDAANFAQDLCSHRPDTVFIEMTDRARLSRAFAAVPTGSAWRPAFPKIRWQEKRCGTALTTKKTLADTARAQSKEALAKGDKQRAIEILRNQARRSFVQAELFHELAGLLLKIGPRDESLHEARYWADRAVGLSLGCRTEYVDRLVQILRELGETWLADGTRQQGRAVLGEICSTLPPYHPWHIETPATTLQ